jgi:hypothetical protein
MNECSVILLILSRNVENRASVASSFLIRFNSESLRSEAGFRRFPRQLTQPADLRGLFLCREI